jgi:hypothetical protein
MILLTSVLDETEKISDGVEDDSWSGFSCDKKVDPVAFLLY